MSRVVSLAPLALALALGVASVAGAQTETPPCGVPEELLVDSTHLRLTKQRLRQNLPIKVVALGAGSSTGIPAGGPEFGWPARLQVALAKRHPGIEIAVVNKSKPRETAGEAVDRIVGEVLSESPHLVIWETGTNDAVRGTDVDDFSRTVQTGIDIFRQKLVDVVVMDMQYSRQGQQTMNLPTYLAALHGVADANDVMMFRRYGIMKYWSKTGVFNYDDTPRAERQRLAAQVYECLARRLAESIEQAVQ